MAQPATPKRYAVTLDPSKAQKGMKLVSLVKTPAIGAGWVALASAAEQPQRRLHLSASPSKQVLTGPLLIPGLEILRLDENGDPFYITFSAEQIEVIAQRFMADGTGLTLSNHNHAAPLEGNTIRELWLTADPKMDKAALYGMDLPAGSLMCSMHVGDSEFWANEVLSGNITGFSIEGLFDFSELSLTAVPAPTPKPMNFLARLQAALLSAFTDTVALATVTLKTGESLEIDEATGMVYTLSETGERGDAQADGTYELADGTELVVAGGMKEGHAAAPAAPGGGATLVPAELAADPAMPATPAAAPAAEGDMEKRLKGVEDAVAEILKIVKKDAPDPAAELSTAQAQLAEQTTKAEELETKLAKITSASPAARRVLMGAATLSTTGEDEALELAKMSPAKRRMAQAKMSANTDK